MSKSKSNVNVVDHNIPQHPFRRAVLRGLGVVLPSLLTIVFLLWMWNAVRTYVLDPAKDLALSVAVAKEWDVLGPLAPEELKLETMKSRSGIDRLSFENKIYCRLPSGEWVPANIFGSVAMNPGMTLPETAEAYYRRHFELKIFRPWLIIPLLLALFILILYLMGKIIAARVGHALWTLFERMIGRLPFVSTVYRTVKKATDFFFADAEIEFSRVVAVQYPSRGLWSIGFVTGESLPDIRNAAAEPVLSVLMPTSPMPATGFTISVRKSETLALNLSVEEAFQFVVSCGVVRPGVDQGRSHESAIQAKVQHAIESAGIVPAVDSEGAASSAGANESSG